MRIEKHSDDSPSKLPLIAALTYRVVADDHREVGDSPVYDPESQVTIHAGRKESRCREDDSVTEWIILKTKSDTKVDD